MTAAIFEQKLAWHCAPALMGIKPANIVTFSIKDEEEEKRLNSLIKDYSQRFSGEDLAFYVLCRCPVSCLVMVYRPSVLEKWVKGRKIYKLLRECGYQDKALDDILCQLSSRVKRRGEWGFPHEIGLFLGYPLEDVIGFMKYKGKDYRYSCYWKVYSDVERAKAWCLRWECARNAAVQAMDSGKSIGEIMLLEEAA